MPIPVNCKTCNYSGHAADSESGKIARCPKCNHLIHVPATTRGDGFGMWMTGARIETYDKQIIWSLDWEDDMPKQHLITHWLPLPLKPE